MLAACAPASRAALSNRYQPDPTITVAVAAAPPLHRRIETILLEWLRDHGYASRVVVRELSQDQQDTLEHILPTGPESLFAARGSIGAANLLLVRVIDDPSLLGKTAFGLTWDQPVDSLRMATTYVYCARCDDAWIRKEVDECLGGIFLDRPVKLDDLQAEP
jgi:hypothetical protein